MKDWFKVLQGINWRAVIVGSVIGAVIVQVIFLVFSKVIQNFLN